VRGSASVQEGGVARSFRGCLCARPSSTPPGGRPRPAHRSWRSLPSGCMGDRAARPIGMPLPSSGWLVMSCTSGVWCVFIES